MMTDRRSGNGGGGNHRVDWKGVYAVAVTPFSERGEFDEPAFRSLVDTLIDERAAGIIVAGSTGEWYSLSDDERAELFRVAVAQAAGRARVLAGTISLSTGTAVRLTRAAADAGCDGVMLTPPPYVMPSDRELFAFFEAVAAVGLPMMLYNNPARTQINLDRGMLTRLLELDAVAAIKDSAKDLGQLAETLSHLGDELAVFCGFEYYVTACIPRGAVGVASMSANVLGGEAVTLYESTVAGQWDRALSAQRRIDRLYEAMYRWGLNPYVVVKEAMRRRGRPGGWPRPPLLSLPDDAGRALDDLVAELDPGSVPA